jgi:plastocyanin
LKFDLPNFVPYFFLPVNPADKFAAFQAAATGNATTTTTTAAPASTTTSGSPTTTGSSQPVHTVMVGGASGLVYTPSNITAQPGDIIQFQFQVKNHTVTQVQENFCLSAQIISLLTYFCSRHLQILAVL